MTVRVLAVGASGTAPFAPPPGVVWRWARHAPGPAERLSHDDPSGPVRIALPAGLACAADKRKAEFLAGRLCAALALRSLGAPEAVGRLGRAPVWPAGVRGSISHAAGVAVAAASRRHAALGVDCEALLDGRAAAEIAPLTLTARDRAAQPAGWDLPDFLTTVFSAKEAAYKALSPRLDDIPDFTEASVEAFGADRLTLRLRGWAIPVLHGRAGGLCVTLAHLE